MHYAKIDGIETKEQALELLKKQVSLRDTMGGALYWTLVNEDCCEVGDLCVKLGCDRNEIREIIGKENCR